jgi:hypothetical protein
LVDQRAERELYDCTDAGAVSRECSNVDTNVSSRSRSVAADVTYVRIVNTTAFVRGNARSV